MYSTLILLSRLSGILRRSATPERLLLPFPDTAGLDWKLRRSFVRLSFISSRYRVDCALHRLNYQDSS